MTSRATQTPPAGEPGPDAVPDVFDPRQYAAGVPHAAYRVLRDHHPVAWQQEHEVLGRPGPVSGRSPGTPTRSGS